MLSARKLKWMFVRNHPLARLTLLILELSDIFLTFFYKRKKLSRQRRLQRARRIRDHPFKKMQRKENEMLCREQPREKMVKTCKRIS